jgi:hypothetical protein
LCACQPSARAPPTTLLADKRVGARRFDFGFSGIPSQSAILTWLVSASGRRRKERADTAALITTSEPN